MPTCIDHIAQVTPKSDKVNIQKLTLNDEERRRTRVMWKRYEKACLILGQPISLKPFCCSPSLHLSRAMGHVTVCAKMFEQTIAAPLPLTSSSIIALNFNSIEAPSTAAISMES